MHKDLLTAVALVLALILIGTRAELEPATAHLQSQNAPHVLERIDQFGGTIRAVAARDDLAFIGVGPRLMVLDVSDPSQPRAIGQSVVLDGIVSAIALRDQMAWVLVQRDGLYAFDVSRPSMPALVSKLSFSPEIGSTSLLLHGDLAVLFHGGSWRGSSSVWLVGIDDIVGLADRQAARIGLDSRTTSVAAAGEQLYIGGAALADDSSPYIISYDILDGAAPRKLFRTEMPGVAAEMAVIDDRLVVAERIGRESASLKVHDLVAAGGLRLVSETPLDIERPSGFSVENRLVALVNGNTLRLVNLRSDGSAEPLAPLLSMPDWYPSGGDFSISLQGEFLFVAANDDLGLRIADLRTKGAFEPVGVFSVPDYPTDIALTDSQILVGPYYTGRIWAYRRTGRAPLEAPTQLPEIWSRGMDSPSVGEFIFSVHGAEIRHFAIDNPAQPVLLNTFPIESEGRDLRLFEEFALVERSVVIDDSRDYVLDAYDLSQPGQASRVLSLSGSHSYAIIAEAHVLVPYGKAMEIFDLDDPGNEPIGRLQHKLGWPVVVAAQGNRIYFTDDETLAVADWTDPAKPEMIAEFPLLGGSGDINDMLLHQGRLVILRWDEVAVYDLTDPDHPLHVASGRTYDTGAEVAARDDRLYITETTGGVSVWDLPEDLGALPTATITPVPTPTSTPTPIVRKFGFWGKVLESRDGQEIGPVVGALVRVDHRCGAGTWFGRTDRIGEFVGLLTPEMLECPEQDFLVTHPDFVPLTATVLTEVILEDFDVTLYVERKLPPIFLPRLAGNF